MNGNELKDFLFNHTDMEEQFLKKMPYIRQEKSLQPYSGKYDQALKIPTNNITRNIDFDGTPDIFNYFPDHKNPDKIIQSEDGIYFFIHPRFLAFPGHSHDFIEINYVYSGRCIQTINGKRIEMNQGEFCILNQNVHHSIEEAGEKDIIVNCLMEPVYFNTAFISRLSGNDVFANFFINAIYRNKESNEYIYIKSSENQKIHNVIVSILCEYYDQGMCSPEIIESYIIILFAELLREYKDNLTIEHSLKTEGILISDIVQYIQNNYTTISLTSISDYFHFDPTYLSKTIKRITGNNFMEFVHQARLNDSCNLLRTTNLPVNTISNEVGYNNISYFYKLFYKYYTCTPAEYRDMNK